MRIGYTSIRDGVTYRQVHLTADDLTAIVAKSFDLDPDTAILHGIDERAELTLTGSTHEVDEIATPTP